MISSILFAAVAATATPQGPEMGQLSRWWSTSDEVVQLTVNATSATAGDMQMSVYVSNAFSFSLGGTATLSTIGTVTILTTYDDLGAPLSYHEVVTTTDGNGNVDYRLPGVTSNDPDLGETQNSNCLSSAGFYFGWVDTDSNGVPENGGCPIPSGYIPPPPAPAPQISTPIWPVSGRAPSGLNGNSSPGTYPLNGGGGFNPLPNPSNGAEVKYPGEGTSLPYEGTTDLANLVVQVEILAGTRTAGVCTNNQETTPCGGKQKYRIIVKGGTLGLSHEWVNGNPPVNGAGGSGSVPANPVPMGTGTPSPNNNKSVLTPDGAPTTDNDGIVTQKYILEVEFTGCGERRHRTFILNGDYSGTPAPFQKSTDASLKLVLTTWWQCNDCSN
jgi:hypothetical protein